MILGDRDDNQDMVSQPILDPISNQVCWEDHQDDVVEKTSLLPKSFSLPPIPKDVYDNGVVESQDISCLSSK